MVDYPWYEIVDGNEQIMQGDFITDCPVIIPPNNMSKEMDVTIKEYKVVIMSQSCDLVQRKIDFVLVCPLWPLSDFGNKNSFFKGKKGKEELRRGRVYGYHMLNKCEINGFKTDYLIVDFRNIFSVSFNFLTKLAKKRGKRIRLLPPYREHLAQAFARFFMRVGLPVDIPPFK